MRVGIRKFLFWFGALLIAWSLVVHVHGQFWVRPRGLRLLTTTTWRPMTLGVLAWAVHLAVFGRHAWRQDAAPLGAFFLRPRRLALSASVVALVLAVLCGAFAASGADAYGYVSQADLWLQGDLHQREPLATRAPWPNADWTFAPLGYRPGERPGTIVPTYSPGLPLTMAALKSVGGAGAGYAVVPLLSALTIWLTFLLGRSLGGEWAGAVAALALLASPTFLFMSFWPMSDVPATAWWLASAVLATNTGLLMAAGSGLAATLAVLTRPNVAYLLLLVALLVAVRAGRLRGVISHLGVWSAAAAVGPILVAFINADLYGSPLRSGYGNLTGLFAWENLGPNLQRYPRWLLETQTPFVLLGVVAPWLLARRRVGGFTVFLSAWCMAFACTVFLGYFWYIPFDAWWFLRFVLPALPMLLGAAATAGLLAIAGLPRHRELATALLTIGLVVFGFETARARGVFRVAPDETRYGAAGEYIDEHLPPEAVVISMQHSGSARYYGHRTTLRYDWLAPEWLDRAVAWLEAEGHPVYVLLDPSERDRFRERFAPGADVSWLDAPPLASLKGGVALYRPQHDGEAMEASK